MIVCQDTIWTDKFGKKREGFYMDGYEVSNYISIPRYLDKGYDCVGIVSGHGKVRIGKSTKASQTCYLIAWLLAGGKLKIRVDKDNKWEVLVNKPPKNGVKFNLYENVAFSAEDLMNKAFGLYKKYGKHQVLLYDEGRQGLDSARAMESINKGMEDFFQECGFMEHVIIIVLPNFFKLHEDYAVARSLFLIDVFADSQFRRGYFNFYNDLQKEKLFFFGKKRIGIRAKYAAASENFWGKFGTFLPFDKKEYEEAKKKALMKKRLTRQQQKWKKQRDALIYMYKRDTEKKNVEIAAEVSALSGQKVTETVIRLVYKQKSGSEKD